MVATHCSLVERCGTDEYLVYLSRLVPVWVSFYGFTASM